MREILGATLIMVIIIILSVASLHLYVYLGWLDSVELEHEVGVLFAAMFFFVVDLHRRK
tara:strand:+ start:276 stop:452 length:177 start_codon:yes stop_codon:yes gene_type:complete